MIFFIPLLLFPLEGFFDINGNRLQNGDIFQGVPSSKPAEPALGAAAAAKGLVRLPLGGGVVDDDVARAQPVRVEGLLQDE
jgi:hypothetical protein